jgi:hypothetical protein
MYSGRIISLRAGEGWGVRLSFARRTESQLHLFRGLRKLLRMVDEIQEKGLNIEGRAPKFAKCGGERRAAQAIISARSAQD